MTSAYSINLNFNNTIPVKTDFTFKQGDKGITLNLATAGLDTTGTTAHIVFKRSNGTSVEAELTGQTGPSYSYTILGNEFEIPGVVVADLKLYNGDTQRVSTASFIFLVTGDTMDGVGGGTGGYSDQLEQLSEEFEDTLNEYKDAFGDVGALNPRGAYDSTADYNVLDLVSYQGSSYLCRTACKNKLPTNTTYWQVFASGGGGGTDDYEDLENKPKINNVTLSGNKTTSDLGLFSGDYNDLENQPTIPSDFDDLADVDMTGVTDGQVPTWDSASQKWKPASPSPGGVTSFNGRAGAVSPSSGDYTAGQIGYDNTSSGLVATDVEAALDELAASIGPTTYKTFSTATDAEIAAMVSLADAGMIDLYDDCGWRVGQEHQVSLAAINSSGTYDGISWSVGESQSAQTITLVLMHKGLYELETPVLNKQGNARSTCSFVVGVKDSLSAKGYMNASDSTSGSWNGCSRRSWCNGGFREALPADIRGVFKKFKTKTIADRNSSTVTTSIDYFAIPAEKEVLGQRTYSSSYEADVLSQFSWYATASNCIKQVAGTDSIWFERSIKYDSATSYCSIASSGSQDAEHANYTHGISPFGCL